MLAARGNANGQQVTTRRTWSAVQADVTFAKTGYFVNAYTSDLANSVALVKREFAITRPATDG